MARSHAVATDPGLIYLMATTPEKPSRLFEILIAGQDKSRVEGQKRCATYKVGVGDLRSAGWLVGRTRRLQKIKGGLAPSL